jgi:hypothetical protein
MNPAEAADELVRYFDPACNPTAGYWSNFPRHAFWAVIDYAREATHDRSVHAAMREELARTWEFAKEEPPPVSKVVREANYQLSCDLREQANELNKCDSLDDCSAMAIYLRALADELNPE